jgi:hypothetical protein
MHYSNKNLRRKYSVLKRDHEAQAEDQGRDACHCDVYRGRATEKLRGTA